MSELQREIGEYIAYLREMGYSITLHGADRKDTVGLQSYNLHCNPYCMLVKSDERAWKRCIQKQEKIYNRESREPFFGMCHAGMEEYIFYVRDGMFVSVSGYGINREEAMRRMNRLTEEFILSREELLQVYDASLKHEPEDLERLRVLIQPLCRMLELDALLRLREAESAGSGELFDQIQAYVQSRFMQNLTVAEIAKGCACSESTVGHVFRKFAGVGVHEYLLSLRMDQACKLLKNSRHSVGTIAELCGFSDPNYFSYQFRKKMGCTPSQYRK